MDIGQRLKLAGYVKNLPDGSVEIFVQEDEEVLNEFMKNIANPPYPIVVEKILKKPWNQIQNTGILK